MADPFVTEPDRDGAWIEATTNADRTFVEIGVRTEDDNGDYTVAVVQMDDRYGLAAALIGMDRTRLTALLNVAAEAGI